MIKLFSLKEEKAKEASAGAASNPKIPPGLIRMQKGEVAATGCLCTRAARATPVRRAVT